MKDTPPSWLADTPAWERREVQRHYHSGTNSLKSSYLNEPVPLQEARERRMAGEPLEYILAHCHAGSFTLKTDSRALVPRPETENLVRQVLQESDGLPPGPIVDCGTGSGFIAGMLAASLTRTVIGVERHREPLELARENRSLHEWDVEFVRADRLRGLGAGLAGIVANLPYVDPESDHLEKSVREHEPHGALFAPGSRRSFYEEFLRQARDRIRPGGILWMELEPGLVEELQSFLEDDTSWSDIERRDDGFGVKRFLRAKRG